MNVKSGQRIGNLMCVGWIIVTGEVLCYWETKEQAEMVANAKTPVGVVFQVIEEEKK